MTFFDKRLATPTAVELFRSSAPAPFPHLVVDNLLNADRLRELTARYPSVDDKTWWRYDNPLEAKFAYNDLSRLDPSFKQFFDEANSPSFLKQLEELSGLEGLIADPTLNGGGLHQIKRGGKLDVHEDYNVHRGLKAWRKLNLIVYLNEDWDPSWGGDLELWDAGMTRCVERVSPVFNRSVIFRTDLKSNHGHPDPLACPEGVTRRSLAVYYYVPMTDEEWATHEYASTRFKKRPDDPLDPEVERLREQRNKGRVT